MPLRIKHDLLNYVNEASVLLSKLYRSDGYSDYYPKPSPEEIESWMSNDPEYDPLETAILETDTGMVIGYALSWAMNEYKPGYARIILDPELPEPLYHEALLALIRWIGGTLAYYDRAIGPVSLYINREYSRLHLSILDIFGGSAVFSYAGSLMEFRGSLDIPIPPGLREEVIHALPDISVIEEFRRVVNDAFSIYPGHTEWSFERAWNYYNLMFNKYRGEFFVITLWAGNEVAGFAEITHYETASGRRIGYVSLLATRREYQGRGIGSYLLARASRLLKRIGIDVLALDSMPKAQSLYEKLGFVPVIRSLKAMTPLEALLAV